MALAASVIEFILCIVAYYFLRQQQATGNEDARLFINIGWVSSIGVNFNIALDGISMVLVLLTCFLIPLIILCGYEKTKAPFLFLCAYIIYADGAHRCVRCERWFFILYFLGIGFNPNLFYLLNLGRRKSRNNNL